MPALNTSEFALYIHVPWCVKKCPYCDFNSHAIRAEIDQAAYLQALLADLQQWLPKVSERQLTSVFIGGGTPSVMSPGFYQELLDALRARLNWPAELEVTLEANPGTADAAHFAGYRQAGINRLSIGVQSLSDAALNQLGRIHDSAQVYQAIDMARQGGFDNINLDFMFALPGQTTAQAMADLSQAIALQPQHLSWYQLTLEPNTPFYADPPPALADDSLAWEIQQAGQQLLASAGYMQYEISAYSQPGLECRHNLNYWQFGDYLGIGAGAHGKLTEVDASNNVSVWRHSKRRHPSDFLAGQYLSSHQQVSPREQVLEFLMNRLRLFSPFDRKQIPDMQEADRDWLENRLSVAIERGLMQNIEEKLALTPAGRQYLNDVLVLFT